MYDEKFCLPKPMHLTENEHSVDPDDMLQLAASHLCLLCLSI